MSCWGCDREYTSDPRAGAANCPNLAHWSDFVAQRDESIRVLQIQRNSWSSLAHKLRRLLADERGART